MRLLLEGALNGVWQGGLLALVVWSVLRASPGVRPRTRYVVWLVTLVAIVALPAFYVAGNWPSPVTPAEAPEVAAIFWTALEAQPAPESIFPIEVPAGDVAWFLLGVWLVGVVGLVVRLAAGYLYLRWLKRSSAPADGRLKGWVKRWVWPAGPGRSAETRTTNAVGLPVAAGLIRPAILFPKKLAEDLTEAEAHDVWLHELAHVRRRDDWTQLAQKLAQTIGFFQPAVYWIGRRMNLERELACDEWVVSRTGAAKSYAACLAKLAALSNQHRAPALGMATHKKQIFRRVEMILSQSKNNSSRRAATAVAVLVALVAGAVAVFALSSPAFVLAHSAEPPPLLAQAKPVPPTPPAPPAPGPAPAAAPLPLLAQAKPVPPAPPAPPSPAVREEMREIRKEMRTLAEEIRKVTKE
ncbi:MAG: M56 family metallopeptidase, partial [bacterium]|nr:M56 family metallopeptidase [bacterium]